jgi:hypothetical protein
MYIRQGFEFRSSADARFFIIYIPIYENQPLEHSRP